jgi:hypothetical protein
MPTRLGPPVKRLEEEELQPQGAQPLQAAQAPAAPQPGPKVQGMQASALSPQQAQQAQSMRQQPVSSSRALSGGGFDANAKRPSGFMGFAEYAGLTGDEMERLEKQATSRTFAAQQKAGRALDEAASQAGASGNALDARDMRANPNANGFINASYGDYMKAQQEANTALQRQQATARGGSFRSQALRGAGGYQAPTSDTDAAAQQQAAVGRARGQAGALAGESLKREQAETRARREAEWNAGQGARAAQELKAAEAELEAADRAQKFAPATGSGVRSIIHPEEYTDIGYSGGLEDTPENRRWLEAQRRVAKAKAGGATQPYAPTQRNSDL